MGCEKKILVIEDSLDLQDLMKMVLEGAGYEVAVAGTGREALTHLSSGQDFSLILLDNTLPDMKAHEFLEKMTNEEFAQSVPIILCSAALDLYQMRWPIQVVSILPKPFQLNDFLEMVNQHILKSAPPTPGLKVNLGSKLDKGQIHF